MTFQGLLDFAIPALAREAEGGPQSQSVSNGLRYMVGNPPYSGHSANKGKWVRDLLRGN